ncbi:MAG TPA: twin-arginine translocase TatA/TatE family subunit [Methylomirabilota bacterium]|nr:twin-arginine translocase TatA/TatE family subunit [Methylomirabilota bacterium]
MPTPGPLELVIILVIALLILGPGRLPDVGSALGKSIREFRKASSDIGDSLKVETTPLPPDDAPPVVPAPAPTVASTTAEVPAEPVGSTSSSATSSAAGTRPSEPTTGTN